LTAVLARAGVPQRDWRWPLGEIDKPFEMRRDRWCSTPRRRLGTCDSRRSQVRQIDCAANFIMSAASLHAPRDVTFYCLDYGGGQLRMLEDLAHVAASPRRWSPNASAEPSASWSSCCWPAKAGGVPGKAG